MEEDFNPDDYESASGPFEPGEPNGPALIDRTNQSNTVNLYTDVKEICAMIGPDPVKGKLDQQIATRPMKTVTASVFRLDNGGTATLRMDYLRPATEKEHGDDRLRIAGTRGVIEFQERTGVVLSTDREGSRTIGPLFGTEICVRGFFTIDVYGFRAGTEVERDRVGQ